MAKVESLVYRSPMGSSVIGDDPDNIVNLDLPSWLHWAWGVKTWRAEIEASIKVEASNDFTAVREEEQERRDFILRSSPDLINDESTNLYRSLDFFDDGETDRVFFNINKEDRAISGGYYNAVSHVRLRLGITPSIRLLQAYKGESWENYGCICNVDISSSSLPSGLIIARVTNASGTSPSYHVESSKDFGFSNHNYEAKVDADAYTHPVVFNRKLFFRETEIPGRNCGTALDLEIKMRLLPEDFWAYS